MLTYVEGGQGGEIDRVPAADVYTDISQVARVRRIGTNVLAFFGILNSPTKSWRQLVSTCEHALISVPASDAVKPARVGRAMQRFIQRCLGDAGKRLDLVRYSSKHDAVGPRSLLAPGRGGPVEEFAEAMAGTGRVGVESSRTSSWKWHVQNDRLFVHGGLRVSCCGSK
jgi:hypothetical protein